MKIFTYKWTSMALMLICVAVSLTILNAPPINDGPFLGDDYLALEAHNSGSYASGYQDSLRNTSADKWRPLNTLLMNPLLTIFGDSYRNFYYFSTVLLALVVLAFWTTQNSIKSQSESKPPWVTLLGVLVIGSSPFTFYARSGVYGLLELGPVILCLCSFSVYQRGKANESRRLVIYSSLIALAAGLIHERFFMFSIALAVIIAWRARTIIRWRGIWLIPLGNVLFYIYSAVIVLNVNILKGGGESKLNESMGPWIVRRFTIAILGLFGGAGGDTIYFESEEPSRFAFSLGLGDYFSFPGLVLIFIPVLLVIWALLRLRTRNCVPDNEHQRLFGCFVELNVVAFFLLIPAATVESRIEARWLFASLVFLILALTSLPPSSYLPSKVGLVSLLGSMIVLNSVNATRYQSFDFWRIRAEKVLEVVQSNEPMSGAWNIAIVWPDSQDNNSVTEWALGYGAVFRNLNNGPDLILFGTKEKATACPDPCLVVEVTDSNRNTDIRDTGFQTIQTSWRN
jgi:hypothetical protein